MNLQWTTTELASCLHLAWCVTHWPDGADIRANPDVVAASLRLDKALSQIDLGCWKEARGEAVLTSAPNLPMDTQIETLVHRLADRYDLVGEIRVELAEALTTLWQLFADHYPSLGQELSARERPLREQWEARSPGFQKSLYSQGFVASQSNAGLTLGLVSPVIGGFGDVGLVGRASAAWIEAMLFHPNPMLPETVRLGWLIAQSLASHESSPGSLCHPMHPIAVLPYVQQAARDVDWIASSVSLAQLLVEWKLMGAEDAERFAGPLECTHADALAAGHRPLQQTKAFEELWRDYASLGRDSWWRS